MGLSTALARRPALRIFHLRHAALPVALFCSACLAEAAPMDIYLPDAPPLTMTGPEGRHGIVGDATLKAAQRAGIELNLIVLPWSRGQRTVEFGHDLLIMPLSRTPDREAKYTWIAPIMTMDRAFFSLDQRVETFEQARRTYRRIAVGMGSAQEQKLRDEGFSDEQIYSLKIGDNPAQMLLLGRVDAWFNGVPESRYIWRGVSARPLLMSPVLMTTELYLACSKTCNETTVQRLAQSVETLRRDGTLQQIADDYLKGL
ncbi:transporter substrate-binding domain-containing protein [Pseudomonas syringae]|nr:transporter substrate-binding domain-containing protein [Pseudomonas syringae]MBD8789106.1 transporter substrate-binding domain-containing protein [Pseudomonas syringae]MBD8800450.1 transporter substrate-binding domain-containing protein [Pseudomonas syringae]MBD8812368.1 transporter substrate-binding domain-containing protein [Pseudomonas syringae]